MSARLDRFWQDLWDSRRLPAKVEISPKSWGYANAHQQVRKIKGRAALRVCQCGSRAAHWAYDHLDPNERHDPPGSHNTSAYSLDPAHYMAMCRRCHYRLDHPATGKRFPAIVKLATVLES